MAGPGFLSTVLDTTGERLKDRLAMEKDFRTQQSQSIIDSLHAVDENGNPKLSPEQQDQAYDELKRLNNSQGAKQILDKSKQVLGMIFHHAPSVNPVMLQRAGQQTSQSLQGGQGGSLVSSPQPTQPTASAPANAGPDTDTTQPQQDNGPVQGQLTDEGDKSALPFTPPPPGRQLPPVQQVANAASQQQPAPQPTPVQQPTGGPPPPPQRLSMGSIIAAGSPAAQDIAKAKAGVTAQEQAGEKLGSFETSQVGPRAEAEERAKLMATYKDPVIVNAMIRMKLAEKGAVALKPGESLGVPTVDKDGNPSYQIQGGSGGRIKDPEEQIQDAGALAVLKKHGQMALYDQMNKDYPIVQQMPTDLKAEAIQEAERIKKTPDPGLEAMRVSMEGMRIAEQERLKQEMDQYSATQGPEAVENYRQLILQSPDAIADVPTTIRGRVVADMKSKGDRVPRILPVDMQQTDFNADQTLARIQRVRDIITKYPDLIGPVANAIGKGQEISGVALQDPDKAAAAADLRGSLTFLQTAEAKAMLGSRPAFSWAKTFSDVTANQKDQAPIMQGALRMQEAHAKLIKKGIDDQRYGGQGGPTPPPNRSNPTGYGPVETVSVGGKSIQARKNLATGKYKVEP